MVELNGLAVGFGREASEADSTRMEDAFRVANPDVIYVDGLAPITALLVAQLEEAIPGPSLPVCRSPHGPEAAG